MYQWNTILLEHHTVISPNRHLNISLKSKWRICGSGASSMFQSFMELRERIFESWETCFLEEKKGQM